ncbi:ANTAR domain-containing protein [Streptomyces sp. NPDC088785]|uniref:ANTAR domain-containing protein n=1 Tax=Streptomyces sp. NPDC088785 TaxID=3365897 RepID=UPI0037FEA8BA
MTSDGMAAVLRALRPGSGGDPALAGALLLGVPGVVVSAFPLPPDAGGARTPEPLWSFPDLAARFDELQFTLGEGPGPDALRAGVPVLEPDLLRVRPDRWPALLPAAQQLGVLGVCCFPLALGGVQLGLLTVLCDGKGTLDRQQLTDVDILTAALITTLLGEPRAPGEDPGDDGSDGDRPWPAEGLHRAVVHQATGMVSVQLGTSLANALVRLRAYAYGSERALGDVAEDVVARRLRFGDSFDGDFDDDESGPRSPDGGEG